LTAQFVKTSKRGKTAFRLLFFFSQSEPILPDPHHPALPDSVQFHPLGIAAFPKNSSGCVLTKNTSTAILLYVKQFDIEQLGKGVPA